VSAIVSRLQQLSMRIRNRLPALLVPGNDEKESERQQAELFQLQHDLHLLTRDLKSQENLLRIQGRYPPSDAWAQKQRLIDVNLEKDQARALARQIEDLLRQNDLNPMDVGYKVHELIENSDIRMDDAKQAIAQARTHSSIGPAAPANTAQMTTLHNLDTAVPIVTFAVLLLRWAAKKTSAAREKDQNNRRAS
jgi:hypothetical protein